MKRFVGPIIIAITTSICIAISELCFRFFAPIPDPYQFHPLKTGGPNLYIRSAFPPNYRVETEAEDGLPGVVGRNLFTTNNMGLRGDYLMSPKPLHEFRIFIVGGSAAEGFYLDDSQAINSILQNELNKHISSEITVKVYNAGRSGDRSDDHISVIVHRIVHLQPDMIIVFSGFNDLLASVYNHDYLHYEKWTYGKSPFLFLRMAATEFQIPRRLYYLIKRASPNTPKIKRQALEQITIKSDYKDRVALSMSAPVSNREPRPDVISYKNNLITIAGVTRALSIRLLFMTQQSTWNSSIDPETRKWQWLLYRDGETIRADLMDKALEALNNVMRWVASEHFVPIYDLAKVTPKSLDFFYDDCHFNVKGAYTAGTGLASFILEKRLIPDRPKGRVTSSVLVKQFASHSGER